MIHLPTPFLNLFSEPRSDPSLILYPTPYLTPFLPPHPTLYPTPYLTLTHRFVYPPGASPPPHVDRAFHPLKTVHDW